jgi:hypothetical protein
MPKTINMLPSLVLAKVAIANPPADKRMSAAVETILAIMSDNISYFGGGGAGAWEDVRDINRDTTTLAIPKIMLRQPTNFPPILTG